MTEIFKLLTPVTYWILIIMWGFILGFYIWKLRNLNSRHLYFTLISILAIDAFRTLFESIYFGTWYTSLAGFIPAPIGELLTRPELVFIPKLLNVFAATIVIILLLKRWVPQEENEKIRSEDAFRASEEKFSAFTNQSFECISVADEEGNYTYVNPAFCKMMGYSEAELLTMTVFDMKSENQDHSSFAKSKTSHSTSPVSVELKRKDGSVFSAEVIGKMIEYGNEKSVLGVVRDLSEQIRQEKERRALEGKVQHAQKLESLGVLAGGIAHDFNNLLTAIMGNASLARDSIEPTSPAYDNIKSIETASTRAAELAMQMLAYSGKGKFLIESINTRKLVEEISNLLEVSISKNVQLNFEFSEDAPNIKGDLSQIRQVIMNLITNASEAIGDQEGVITLATGRMECSESYLQQSNIVQPTNLSNSLAAGLYSFVKVTDTGCGMDQETMEKVFDPFFTTKFTGRGLGMSAVLGILRGHHSALKATSEVGKGTSFTVLFPAFEINFQTAGKVEPVQDDHPDWKGKGVILLVDDEELVRTVGERGLKRLGYDVLLAANGLEALELYAQHGSDIECVLLDLTMPTMGGKEALAAIRKLDAQTKIVICSGYSEEETMDNTALKADAFLHKPYQMDELKRLLKKIIAPQRMDRP